MTLSKNPEVGKERLVHTDRIAVLKCRAGQIEERLERREASLSSKFEKLAKQASITPKRFRSLFTVALVAAVSTWWFIRSRHRRPAARKAKLFAREDWVRYAGAAWLFLVPERWRFVARSDHWTALVNLVVPVVEPGVAQGQRDPHQ